MKVFKYLTNRQNSKSLIEYILKLIVAYSVAIAAMFACIAITSIIIFTINPTLFPEVICITLLKCTTFSMLIAYIPMIIALFTDFRFN